MAGPSRDRGSETANQRWKRRWRYRLVCSLAVAVGLHLSILLWPGRWNLPGSPSVPPADRMGAVHLLSVASSEGGPGGRPLTAPAVPEPSTSPPTRGELDGDEERAGAGAGSQGQGGAVGRRSDLWERLRGRAPVPTITESAAEAPVLSTIPGTDGTEDVRAALDRTSPVPLSDPLDVSGPDLDRLSVVEPQLSGTTPTGWILVRNRSEVRRFIRWGYTRGALDRDAAGTVNVAIWVDDKGKVKWAEIADSSGRRDLDRMALNLFQNVVEFWPAREDGVAVPTSAIFSVVFPWP